MVGVKEDFNKEIVAVNVHSLNEIGSKSLEIELTMSPR